MNGNKTYIVKKGDNLYQIANAFHTTVKQIMELNHLENTVLHEGQVLIISQETMIHDYEESYEQFLKKNLGQGTLKVQTLIGSTYFPIKNTKIEVYKTFNQEKMRFFSGYTDESGVVDNILLPSPIRRQDYSNGASIYQIEATHPNYQTANIYEVYIYDGIKSIQKIEMLPQEYISGKGSLNGQ